MSYEKKPYDQNPYDFGSGGFTNSLDHKFFSYWDDWVNSIFDYSDESDPSDGYEDNNGFYRMSISHVKKKSPEDFFEDHKKEFMGQVWKPNKFFQRLYLKNILSKTSKFIDSLNELDLSDIPRKAYIKDILQKANRELKKAHKKYERDQVQCLISLVQSLEYGKKIMECLKKLDVEGRLD